MRLSSYVISALAGCLLGAAFSYLRYKEDDRRLTHSYGAVVEALVSYRKKNTDAGGYWYNGYVGEAGEKRSRSILNLIKRGDELALQLWLLGYLPEYSMTGLVAMPLFVSVARRAIVRKRTA